MDRLKVDGDVVDSHEEAASEDERKSTHHPDRAVLGDARRNHGPLTLEPLQEDPCGYDENKANQETNDNRRIPVMGLATILYGEDIADGSTHHQRDAQRVELTDLLKQGSLFGDGMAGSLEEDEDDERRNSSDGQVDVEAPSPSGMVGESREYCQLVTCLEAVAYTHAPPSKGPMTLATPYDAPMMPVKAGLFFGGAEKAMIV